MSIGLSEEEGTGGAEVEEDRETFINGTVDEGTEGGSLDGWTDGWIIGWMNGWMDGWID